MKFKSIWQSTRDFTEVNRKLVIAFVVCLLGVFLLQFYVTRPTLEILGIADSKETAIAYESAVVVKRIFVLPGQKVIKGQRLVEVEQNEINLKLAELETQLDTLKSQKELRDVLVSSLQDRKPRKVKGKKGKKGKAVREAPSPTSSPMDEEIIGLEKQIDQIKKQKEMAVRYANHDGVVAAVNFKDHESVAPFQPILTLTTHVPNLVYGFVNENRLSQLQVGDWVQVEAASGEPRRVRGEIVSLGSRITPFPERLQGSLGTPYWGREVVVAIPESNDFLMAEKVRIKLGYGSAKIEGGERIEYALRTGEESGGELDDGCMSLQKKNKNDGRLKLMSETKVCQTK